MGWFDSPQSVSAPATQKAEPLDKLNDRLDTFGSLRIAVHDPDLKMFISRSVWSALPYVNRISSGTPRGSHYSDLTSDLDLLIDTVQKYITIQNSGQNDADSQDLLRRGRDAVKAWLIKLEPSALNLDTTLYKATTKFLTENG